MAKKEKLSLDELLEQALVKDEDKPYDVPSNWVWTRLGKISEIIMGQSPRGEDTTDDSTYVPLIGGASDMGDLFPKVNRYTKKPTKLSQLNDVILSIRATLGRPIFSDGEYCLGRGVAAIRTKLLSSKFIKLFILNNESYLYDVASGTTFLQVSRDDLENIPFALPPVLEQQRIVDLIESLFEKLDRAKELVQNALDSFEERKSAILYKAFSGELTAKWREENGLELKYWDEKKLDDVCSLITDGTHQTPTYVENGYVFLSSKNVTSGKIDWDNVKYIPEELHEKLYSRLAPKVNDILLAKNGTTGIGAIVEKDCVFDIYVSLALLRPMEDILPHYLLYVLNSPETKGKFKLELTGIGVPNLHLRDIRKTTIPVPSLPEQKEIVRIIDNLLDKEQKAKELYEVIVNIDLMKKSILARAFRGELNLNKPNEESALELLKEVLRERDGF